jgi:serine/threonine protein kinase
LHSKNIIHRDIKPENILLDDGNIKISDFGWSIFSPEGKRTTLCGTMEYLSPEMVYNLSYTHEVDIWCLGVLCFELATGKSPFSNPNAEVIKKNIRNVDLKYPSHLSKCLKSFIKMFLLKEPTN